MRKFVVISLALVSVLTCVTLIVWTVLDANAQQSSQWNPTYPPRATAITGNATGTTGAVVGTLAAAVGQTTYICGFNVSTVGGTAASSPITVAGLTGSSQVYQTPVNATGGQIIVSQTFIPCIPASAVNTAITVTTTAAAGATAVDVNSWGYLFPQP